MRLELELALFFLVILAISVIVQINSNMKFQNLIDKHNLDVLLSIQDEFCEKDELVKEKKFFKLNNTGKHPSEIKKLEAVRYSTDDDYFLKRDKECYGKFL